VGQQVRYILPETEKVDTGRDSERACHRLELAPKWPVSDDEEPGGWTRLQDEAECSKQGRLILRRIEPSYVTNHAVRRFEPENLARHPRVGKVPLDVNSIADHHHLGRRQADLPDEEVSYLVANRDHPVAEWRQHAESSLGLDAHHCEVLVLNVHQHGARQSRGEAAVHQLSQMVRLHQVRLLPPEQPVERDHHPPIEARAAPHDTKGNSGKLEILGERTPAVEGADRGLDAGWAQPPGQVSSKAFRTALPERVD